MSRTMLLASFALAMGCSAQLRNGVYGCADTRCPAGYFCHAGDHLCYTTPEDAGTDAGVDAAETPDMGIGPVDMGMSSPDMGVVFTCGGMMNGSCPAGQMCVMGQWTSPPAMPTYACATTIATTHHGDACTPGDTTCSAPDVCITAAGSAHCMRPCMPGGQCGFMEECVVPAGAAMGGVCARPCGTCPLPSLTCSSSMHCLPPGW